MPALIPPRDHLEETPADLETPCLDDETLAEIVAGRLPLSAHPEIERHFDSCPTCQGLVALALGGASGAEPAPASKARVPERVAHYRIERCLGRGGMGEVYRAYDERLNRPVAIKLLPFALADSVDRQRRLVREARSAARLNHPGIVTVHDVGSWGGQVYLVMEIVEGTRFTDVARAACPPGEALRLVAEAADALGAAHVAGIYHRDIKSDNLLVTAEGRVKVLDFGLAKQAINDGARDGEAGVRDAEGREAGSLATSPAATGDKLPATGDLSRTGHVVGTPAFMSPEQTLGQPIDARSEVFSLGIVLYELLTGTRPFDRRTVADTLEAIRNSSPVPPTRRRRNLPRAVDALIARALARRPADRYPDMAAFAAACRRVLGARGRRLRLGLAAAGLAGVITGAIALASPSRGWRDGDPLRPATVTGAHRLTFVGGCAELPRFTPDGRTLLFDSGSDGNYDVFAVDLDRAGSGAAPRALTTSPKWDYAPTVSPDGKWVAYQHGDEGVAVMLQRLDAPAGSSPVKVGTSRGYVAFSPDGRLIGSNEGELFAWTLGERGEVRATSRVASLAAGSYARFVIAFPDGGLVAALSEVSRPDELPLVEIEGGVVTRVQGETTPHFGGITAGHDGRGYYYVRSALAAQSQVAWRARGQAGPGLIVEGGLAPRAGLVLDPAGRRLAFSTCTMAIELVRLRPSGEITPWSATGAWKDRHPLVLRDGRVLVASDRDGHPRLWQVGRGADDRPLGDWDVQSFAVSPDGRLLVYSDPVVHRLVLVPFDGSAAPRTLTSGFKDDSPSFTHDGARIVFRRDAAGESVIHTVPVEGGAVTPLTRGANPQAARDADRIALVRFGAGTTNVYLTDQHGTEPVPIPGLEPGIAEGAIALSPDGTRLLIATHEGPVIEIRADGSARRNVWTGRTDGFHSVDWAPDGDGLLATRIIYQGSLWVADGRFR